MQRFAWLRKRKIGGLHGCSSSARKLNTRFRPRLESLETRLTPSFGLSTLALFDGGANGSEPGTGFFMDGTGDLYGTTSYGGANGAGTIFEIAKGTSTIATLASLGQPTDDGLIMDGSGDLYGTTGSWVFELAKGSNTITNLASFNWTNGADPNAGLTLDKSGNLYGTTQASTDVDGTVFELPAAAASHPSVEISGFSAAASAGTASTFTITVQNPDGTIDTGYTGTVHFMSTDPQAVLPADYTFSVADAGVHTFTATLKTAGMQAITATDATNSFITGSAISTVTAAAASHLVITGPSTATAGNRFSITVTAYDAYGNVATGYTGTVDFQSSDKTANLPADYTFTSSDNGTHTFSGFMLKKKGKQSITVTDTRSSAITGSLTVAVS
jgi:uncharacterized repeat protein (TIGR03803 family)